MITASLLTSCCSLDVVAPVLSIADIDLSGLEE